MTFKGFKDPGPGICECDLCKTERNTLYRSYNMQDLQGGGGNSYTSQTINALNTLAKEYITHCTCPAPCLCKPRQMPVPRDAFERTLENLELGGVVLSWERTSQYLYPVLGAINADGTDFKQVLYHIFVPQHQIYWYN